MQRLRNCLWGLIVTVIVLVGVCLAIAVARWFNRDTGFHFWNTTSVIRQVQSLADLVTVKYTMEKVVVLEDVKWYGESRVLFLAHGVVKAGIDFKRLQPGDVSISGRTISFRLPQPQIFDAYLDDKESRVIDRETGILRAFDKDLEQTVRQNAVDDIARAARRGGILQEAEIRGQRELEEFFKLAGFERVLFR